MNHPNRYLYEQQVYSNFNNIMYWRLLYRMGLVCIGVFFIIGLVKQSWLVQANYLSVLDITALIIIPLIMTELILRRHQYPNKRWNSMILLASFIIGLSSLGVFY